MGKLRCLWVRNLKGRLVIFTKFFAIIIIHSRVVVLTSTAIQIFNNKATIRGKETLRSFSFFHVVVRIRVVKPIQTHAFNKIKCFFHFPFISFVYCSRSCSVATIQIERCCANRIKVPCRIRLFFWRGLIGWKTRLFSFLTRLINRCCCCSLTSITGIRTEA